MTCASCARIVERGLKKIEGIEYVSVNLATEKAYVVGNTSINEEILQRAVEKTGYHYSADLPADDVLEQNSKKQGNGP